MGFKYPISTSGGIATCSKHGPEACEDMHAWGRKFERMLAQMEGDLSHRGARDDRGSGMEGLLTAANAVANTLLLGRAGPDESALNVYQ